MPSSVSLSPAEGRLLKLLHRLGGKSEGPSYRDLAAAYGCSVRRVFDLIGRLEEHGALRRGNRGDPHFLIITPKGRRAIQ